MVYNIGIRRRADGIVGNGVLTLGFQCGSVGGVLGPCMMCRQPLYSSFVILGMDNRVVSAYSMISRRWCF